MASRRTLCLLEASKLGLILNYDPSGERNRCFYQCLGKHLRVDKVEDVIDALEKYMLHNRLVPVENEVSMCFYCTGLGPGVGGGIPYKSYTGCAALPGRVFGPLARKQGNLVYQIQNILHFHHKQGLKFSINS